LSFSLVKTRLDGEKKILERKKEGKEGRKERKRKKGYRYVSYLLSLRAFL
jgi:hypothetical protein